MAAKNEGIYNSLVWFMPRLTFTMVVLSKLYITIISVYVYKVP